jgi:imidazolonepropionase-like amidohydrolase
MKTRILLGLLALALALPVAAQQSSVTVIQNATILTVTQGTIEGGSLLIRNGKIAEVGKSIKVPAGATVIDATGLYVTPGIIDCHCTSPSTAA